MFRYLVIVLVMSAFSAAYENEDKSVRWIGGTSLSWPSTMTRNIYKSSGKYVGKNMMATRGVIHGDEAIVTVPRFKKGVPLTLAKVDLKNCQTKLSPFPCWSLQEEGNCKALQSAIDVFLDPNNILWVLDTGIVNSLVNPVRRCPPKIMAFNVNTQKLVRTVDLSQLASNTSRLQYLVVDYAKNGHIFVYVTDAANNALLVQDVTSGRGYSLDLPKAVANGCDKRDVLYAALIRRPDGDNRLVFSYLNGRRVFSIKSQALQKGCKAANVEDLGSKPQNMVILGTDGGAALFFRSEGESDIYRMDVSSCFSFDSIRKVYSGTECELPTHVMPDYRINRMRVLESNFPDYFQGTVGCGVNHAIKLF